MALDPEAIVERRRLRRKLSFWRFAGFFLLALVVTGGLVAWLGEDEALGLSGPKIARVNISGFIADSRDEAKALEKLAKDDSVKAVVVAIDSTGGATVGGETLYLALRDLAEAKPTVATIGTVGASAAYMAAIATDHIVARRASITGSIGVLFQYPEVSELLDKVGVDVEEIKSGPLKATPSPFEPTTEEARQVLAGLVADSYDWFVEIVRERRQLDPAELALATDGRVFSGRQALAAKLIDEIGGEDEAIAWLEKERGVTPDLPVRNWPLGDSTGPFSVSAAVLTRLARLVGWTPFGVGEAVIDEILPESLKLDGLVSVWHPSLGRHDGEGASR